jgi:hypothetical protein
LDTYVLYVSDRNILVSTNCQRKYQFITKIQLASARYDKEYEDKEVELSVCRSMYG